MHLLKTNINGNPNVGLYGYCTNDYCLVGIEVPEEQAKIFEEVLKVPVHRLTIGGTSLLGVFLNGNSTKLLIPSITFDTELKTLDKLKIPYEIINSKQTCFGNLLLCNDQGCLASPDFSARLKKQIRQALNVNLHPGTIGDLETVGSLSTLNSNVCIVSHDISNEEKAHIEELLGIECIESSISMGSPYINSGIICNDNGMIIGDLSGGPEIVHIDGSLFPNK